MPALTPKSRHIIGSGRLKPGIRGETKTLHTLSKIIPLIRRAGFTALCETAVRFGEHGATYVVVLAESHLVIHVWGTERFFTFDLHLCDFRRTNRAAVGVILTGLRRILASGPLYSSWKTLRIPGQPTRRAVEP